MPDTLINAKACDQVADCTGWDEIFCICTFSNESSGACSPAEADSNTAACYPTYNPGFVDAIPGLIGTYSTTCTDAGTLPTTGFDPTPQWQNVDNAKSDDGTFASITPTPIPIVSGEFNNTCLQGTDYLVLTGFNFDIVPEAMIWGIGVALKGYALHTTIGDSGTLYGGGATKMFNIALMLSGVPYYRADPRTYSLSREVSFPPEVDTPCGTQTSATPYPIDNCFIDDGGPVQIFAYSQPVAESDIGNFLLEGPPGTLVCGQTPPFINTPPEIIPTIVSGMSYVGSVAACPPPITFSCNTPTEDGLKNVDLAVIQKDMFIPTLKQSWTAAEVNDSSFGVAISFYTRYATTRPDIDFDTQFLDCVGICVYYTLTGGGGGGSISPCPSPVIPTGNPFSSRCGG